MVGSEGTGIPNKIIRSTPPSPHPHFPFLLLRTLQQHHEPTHHTMYLPTPPHLHHLGFPSLDPYSPTAPTIHHPSTNHRTRTTYYPSTHRHLVHTTPTRNALVRPSLARRAQPPHPLHPLHPSAHPPPARRAEAGVRPARDHPDDGYGDFDIVSANLTHFFFSTPRARAV